MSELRKTSSDEIYFITMTIMNWIDLFSREIYKEIVTENLKYCQENEKLEIYAYVIMSNHLHLVCSRRDENLNELIGRFKSYTSKLFIREIENNFIESRRAWLLQLFSQNAQKHRRDRSNYVWKYTNHAKLLKSNWIVEQKINYIHQNPVKAGIVTEAHYYKYSSACPDGPIQVFEI
ncbi:MAG: transposase [Flavobacteriales bacterium]|nr:transposase [Flavobacteriales bacterium]